MIVHKAKLETYTWKTIPVIIHAKVATIAHYRETYVPRLSRVTHIDSKFMRVTPFPINTLKRPFSRMHLDEEPKPREESIGSTMPLPSTREPRLERTRGRRIEANKNIRPSTLQKLCRKFNGSRDSYDHIAQYRQLLFA